MGRNHRLALLILVMPVVGSITAIANQDNIPIRATLSLERGSIPLTDTTGKVTVFDSNAKDWPVVLMLKVPWALTGMSGKLGDKAPLEVLKYALESGQRRWNYGRNLYMEVPHISATFVFQIEGNQKHNIYTSEFYSEKTGQPAQISHKIEAQDYKPPVFKNEIETCKATTCFNYAQGQITSSAKDGTCVGQRAVINKVSYQVVKERWQIFDGQGSMINIRVPYKTREVVELHQELSPCQSKASALQESGILRPKN